MKTQPRLLLLLALAGALVGLVVGSALNGNREPEYKGKKLSDWVVGLRIDPSDETTRNAISSIGTDAIPYLLRWIRYERPAWKAKLDSALARLNVKWKFADKEMLAEGSSRVFRVLGPEAATAVPELNNLFDTARTRGPRMRALEALIGVGAQGLPRLLNVLTNRQEDLQYRVRCARGIGSMGDAGGRAIAFLVRCLEDEPQALVDTAANSIGRLHLEPDVALPALIRTLQSTNWSSVLNAVSALEAYGPAARPAVPALRGLAQRTDWFTRSRATNAISRIEAYIREGGTP